MGRCEEQGTRAAQHQHRPIGGQNRARQLEGVVVLPRVSAAEVRAGVRSSAALEPNTAAARLATDPDARRERNQRLPERLCERIRAGVTGGERVMMMRGEGGAGEQSEGGEGR